MDALWSAFHASAPALYVRESVWAYPALETIHVLGLGLVVGSILAFDLRLLGWHRELPVASLGRHLLPWVWTGFLLNAASGALLFASDAVEFAANASFRVKMVLIVLAGLNALWFQARVAPGMAAWNLTVPPPAGARLAALVSITLWVAIVTAGRMMAYIK